MLVFIRIYCITLDSIQLDMKPSRERFRKRCDTQNIIRCKGFKNNYTFIYQKLCLRALYWYSIIFLSSLFLPGCNAINKIDQGLYQNCKKYVPLVSLYLQNRTKNFDETFYVAQICPKEGFCKVSGHIIHKQRSFISKVVGGLRAFKCEHR